MKPKVIYHIYHPKGSLKLKANNEVEARLAFETHDTLRYDIAAGERVRKLIRETREDITPP